MAIINDYNELERLYSQMAQNKTASLNNILSFCYNATTIELYDRLFDKVYTNTKSFINKAIEHYIYTTNEGLDTNILLQEWEKTTPCDVYEKLLKKIDVSILNQYIDAGLYFFPCNNDKTPICKIKDNKGETIEKNKINDAQRLNNFLNGSGTLYTADGKEWTNKEQITVFSFYPKHNKLLCIDIDNATKEEGTTHGIGTNGIIEFMDILKSVDMTDTQKRMFDNFPANFPCYVTTPNGGLHLYFKLPQLPANWNLEKNIKDKDKETNVECKYNAQITIAGSTRNGKRYVLHGDLKKIPFIPLDLLNKCCKPRHIIQPQKKHYKPADNTKQITPQFCIDRGKKYAGACGHNTMFASVVSNFHYFYEETHDEQLNASNCKSYILQDYDYISWQDADKESQIDNTIKQYFGR